MKHISKMLVFIIILTSMAFAQEIMITKVINNFGAVNKGMNDGVRNGHIYQVMRQVNNQWTFITNAEVVSVRETNAAIKCENESAKIQIGDFLFEKGKEETIINELLSDNQTNQTITIPQPTRVQNQPVRTSRPSMANSGTKKTFIGVGGGVSQPIGDGSEYWKMGFWGGGNVFVKTSSNLFFGGRVAYNVWNPNTDELTRGYSSSGVNFEVSGNAKVLEVIPAVRLGFPISPDQSSMFFAQAGYGIYKLDADIEVSGSYMGSSSSYTIEMSESKSGVSFGGGIMIAKKGGIGFEILGLYNIIFSEGSKTKFWTAGAGIIL